MHGFGIIIWPSGDAFEGEFVEDKKSGFGIFYNKQAHSFNHINS